MTVLRMKWFKICNPVFPRKTRGDNKMIFEVAILQVIPGRETDFEKKLRQGLSNHLRHKGIYRG